MSTRDQGNDYGKHNNIGETNNKAMLVSFGWAVCFSFLKCFMKLPFAIFKTITEYQSTTYSRDKQPSEGSWQCSTFMPRLSDVLP